MISLLPIRYSTDGTPIPVGRTWLRYGTRGALRPPSPTVAAWVDRIFDGETPARAAAPASLRTATDRIVPAIRDLARSLTGDETRRPAPDAIDDAFASLRAYTDASSDDRPDETVEIPEQEDPA